MRHEGEDYVRCPYEFQTERTFHAVQAVDGNELCGRMISRKLARLPRRLWRK